jgi:hypothetical protein
MAKRRGSSRFSPVCKNEFKTCIRNEMQDPRTARSASPMRVIGKTCMPILHQCQARRGHNTAMKQKRRRGSKRR